MAVGRSLKRAGGGAVLLLLALVAWQFAGIVRKVGAPAPARVPALRLGAIHTGMGYAEVEDLLGTPDLGSDVYRDRNHLIQCWYYDVRSETHLEVCFDHRRVYYKHSYE
jgi:hypothetical protein